MSTSSTTQPQHSPQKQVSYCINPSCPQRQNSDNLESCQACGTPLLIKNRYRLVSPLRPLDENDQAEVFEVEDLGVEAVRGERYKVLKVLLKTKNSTLVRLFKQEAETLKKLNHPGIPRVELADGYFTISLPRKLQPLHCLVMEKIQGEDLENWVNKNGSISQEKALEWLKQLLEILDHLHQQQYLHRDIKPSNIMLRPTGQLVLIDFGALRQITNTFLLRLGMRPEDTGTGIVSPGYTAPEQINGRAVPQSDLYALGHTFVHLLTGKHPVELKEDPQTGQLIWRDYAKQISAPLADWIDYLMATFPWQRPLNASLVLQHLEEGLPPPPVENLPSPPPVPPTSRTPAWLIILNVVLFFMLLVTGGQWFQRQQNQWQVSPQKNSPAGTSSN